MNNQYANNLIKKTKIDYNTMALVFSSKRWGLTNDIFELKKYVDENDRILDLGCGNGRLVELFEGRKIRYFGVDISDKLIALSRAKYPRGEFRLIDNSKFPYPPNFFNKIYCLSVLHHIPSLPKRIQFLKETKRVIKPNGRLILTVWYVWKKPKLIRAALKNIFLKLFGISQLEFKDAFYPFKDSQGNVLAERFIHCFTSRELKQLVRKSGYSIEKSYILKRGKMGMHANLCLIAKPK